MRLTALASACLLALASAAWSTEQVSLIIEGGNGAVTINPGVGLATQLAIEAQQTRRQGFVNFLDDVNYLENSINGVVNEETFNNLRVGSPDVVPTVDGLIRMFPDKPSKRDNELGRGSMQSRLRDAEKEFWSHENPYDGNVAGAYDGQYLMLAIPSKRTVVFYESDGENLKLKAWYNIGPALYVNSVIRSEPEPAKLVQELKLDPEERKSLEGAFAGKPDEVPQIQPPQFWCMANKGVFALVDSANLKIITFTVPGKKVELRSVRNLAIDLLIPGMATIPTDQDGVEKFKRLRGSQLGELGVTILDVPYVKALVSQTAVGDTAKAGAFQAIATGGLLALFFPAERKVMTYNTQGSNNSLQLVSVRDTTFDAGLAILDQQLHNRALAQPLLKQAEKDATRAPDLALRLVKTALNFNPDLHLVVEKSSYLRPLAKMADWDKILADATKASEAAKTKRETIETLAKAEREKRKKR